MIDATFKPLDAMRWIWAESEVDMTTIEKAVLSGLVICRNKKTARCDPSHATLAKYASASTSAVDKALGSLEARGLVKRKRRYRDGSPAPAHKARRTQPLGSTSYELTLPFGTPLEKVGTPLEGVGVPHQAGHGTPPGGEELINRTANTELPKELKDTTGGSRRAAPLAVDVARVFNSWSKTLAPLMFPKGAQLTAGRKRSIEKALKTHTVEELERAITGARASSFHCGDNDRGRMYLDLGTIFKTPEKIDDHYAHGPAKSIDEDLDAFLSRIDATRKAAAPRDTRRGPLVQQAAKPGEYDWRSNAPKEALS